MKQPVAEPEVEERVNSESRGRRVIVPSYTSSSSCDRRHCVMLMILSLTKEKRFEAVVDLLVVSVIIFSEYLGCMWANSQRVVLFFSLYH
jgi:hypothetical protein